MAGNEPFPSQPKVLSTHRGEVGIPPSGKKNAGAGVGADIYEHR